MSKGNKILFGCLAILLVMSVGYALFSEQITISGTATANGTFDIEISEPKLIKNGAAAANEVAPLPGETEKGYVSKGAVTFTVDNPIDKNSVTLTGNLKKPTDKAVFKVKITNKGTIPAWLKDVTSDNDYVTNSTVPGKTNYVTEGTANLATHHLDPTTLLVAHYDVKGHKNSNAIPHDNGTDSGVKQLIMLDQGQSIDVYVIMEWLDSDVIAVAGTTGTQPTLSTLSGGTTHSDSITYNLGFVFEQITAAMAPSTTAH